MAFPWASLGTTDLGRARAPSVEGPRRGAASHLHGDGVADVRGQVLHQLQIAAQQAQRPHAGVGRGTVGVLVGERVHDVDDDGRGIRDGVRVAVCGNAHFLLLHGAEKERKRKRERERERGKNMVKRRLT